MTPAEISAKRRENRKLMKTATGEMRRLCEELDAIYAMMAYRIKHPLPSQPGA
jgi:hypothetical protein